MPDILFTLHLFYELNFTMTQSIAIATLLQKRKLKPRKRLHLAQGHTVVSGRPGVPACSEAGGIYRRGEKEIFENSVDRDWFSWLKEGAPSPDCGVGPKT